MARYVTSALKSIREQIAPVRTESAFLERGVLTPEEFVAAGDQLVFRCPTWTWEAGDPKKRRDFLPADKQYLRTRNVPCHQRVGTFERDYAEETEVEDSEGADGEGWLATHTAEGSKGGAAAGSGEEEEVETIGGAQQGGASGGEGSGPVLLEVRDGHFHGGAEAGGEEDEYADIATFQDDNLAENDEATLQPASYLKAEEPGDSLIVATRTYDISITYDKYYQTPKAFLFGYDEHGRILEQEEVFEDIMQDYAQRTVTFERHPHLDEMHASIHPCQHAKVMKRIVENLQAGGAVPRTDQYLFIFLKFLQSVIPTIAYDWTTQVDAGGLATAGEG